MDGLQKVELVQTDPEAQHHGKADKGHEENQVRQDKEVR
jgi:hypothetical protein